MQSFKENYEDAYDAYVKSKKYKRYQTLLKTKIGGQETIILEGSIHKDSKLFTVDVNLVRAIFLYGGKAWAITLVSPFPSDKDVQDLRNGNPAGLNRYQEEIFLVTSIYLQMIQSLKLLPY